MTIRELIDELEDLAEEHGDGVEVRLAHQPRWPFEYDIAQVVATGTGDGDEDEEPTEEDEDADPVVYIGEGSQLGYLPGEATQALGWGRR